ncbi:OPT family oligopeptide transporter [Peredibacter sp. HCB2-198]|uniref:OPT family oligopeptide transporter n=1 Tax=Peredibacter sp. HCB2-198 TaxID=3383025 RepID=UPI0038B53BE6
MSKDFKPFISHAEKLKEFTLGPILMGVFLGILFGASSLYLALKVGMTVSASIPVAVLSITLFKGISKMFGLRHATILENNMVQTTGSAGESIAFGVAVTMPALLILGYDLDVGRIMTVSILGGLLGVLMMIPLRQALIVKEHGKLIYPEGTACAEVLIVGEKGGSSGKIVFGGFFLGLFYKFFNVGLRLWKDVPERAFSFFKGSAIAAEVSPELLGVGYIIGLRTAAIMMAGGVLSSFVLIPMISLFGSALTEPLFPAKTLIRDMEIHDIWRNYVLYIGAGAVAAGGIISLFQSLPTIIHGAKSGLKSVMGSKGPTESKNRTEDDLPFSFVIIGTILMVLGLWFAPALHINLFSAVLIVLFGFLFVTVSSRLTGEIGSSSNPISGMTVATLLLTCLVFLAVGWIGPEHRVGALSIAAVVCIAASNGGTTSQDLKTGYLVGATPRLQQWGLLIGALTSAIVIGYSLILLNDASTVYTKKVPDYTVTNMSLLKEKQKVAGVESLKDQNEYYVLQVTEQSNAEMLGVLGPGKYLVDDAGKVTYLVDPGINGSVNKRDDGTSVTKYEAPKARLMSLIIDGILTQKLPWGLVLLGVALAIVLELCGISALPFAVGVYLPISASAPIFVGGIVRWLVERKTKAPESELEADTGPGVLFSSGLIAGGSIAGILLAITQIMPGVSDALDFSGKMGGMATSDLFATLVFGGAAAILFAVGRKKPKL